MTGSSLTTAAIISFCEELEDASSTFYETLAGAWPGGRAAFLAFASDGAKNKAQVIRTYQETISDALEASYSFEGLNLEDYAVEPTLDPSVGYPETLRAAIALEEKACEFYLDVAERSESLLATIPRAFKRVAKKRNKRLVKLKDLLAQTQT
jgi:rubrerythrin